MELWLRVVLYAFASLALHLAGASLVSALCFCYAFVLALGGRTPWELGVESGLAILAAHCGGPGCWPPFLCVIDRLEQRGGPRVLVLVSLLGFAATRSLPFTLGLTLLVSARRARRARERAQTFRSSATELQARELEIAAEVQSALMPRESPSVPGWSFDFAMAPARSVGGDLVQYLQDGTRIGCVVADVAGKGVPAAILVGSLHQLIHRVGYMPLPEAMAELNLVLCSSFPDGYSVALLMLWLDVETGEIEWINAGSPYPLCRRHGGTVEEWSSADPCAGWLAEVRYEVQRDRLSPGDTLFIFTDGLSDVETRPGVRQGEQRIVEALREHPPGEPLSALRDKMLALTEEGRRTDDITLLALRREEAELPTTAMKVLARDGEARPPAT